MTRSEILNSLTEAQVVGLTIWAESRSEPIEGQIAVGCVLRNRMRAARGKAWGLGWKGVCLHPWQFSCWNEGPDKNYKMVISEANNLATGFAAGPQLATDIHIAEGIIKGVYIDPSNGASHYYAPKAMVPPGSVPIWVTPKAILTTVIANHRFYKAATGYL
jgi:hypothetical protein